VSSADLAYQKVFRAADAKKIIHFAIVVSVYDEVIEFYINVLWFQLLEETFRPEEN
jgi:predicted enzyme related to lactoylglutathione lyase